MSESENTAVSWMKAGLAVLALAALVTNFYFAMSTDEVKGGMGANRLIYHNVGTPCSFILPTVTGKDTQGHDLVCRSGMYSDGVWAVKQ